MDGAESIVRTAAAAGAGVCFANAGTTEVHLVRALDAVPEVRPVLGLFEGVCSGAADGWARMTGRPALALLHLGPGLANAGANLHNANRARAPVIALVGDHARAHHGFNSPLETDIESIARPLSTWVRTTGSAAAAGADCADAIAAALSPPGGVATLVVPADCGWEPAPGPAPPRAPAPRRRVDDAAVDAAVAALTGPEPVTLLLGGPALGVAGQLAAARVAAATGCLLVAETFPGRMERGGALPRVERLPYLPEMAEATLARGAGLVTAGASDPVAFFLYEGGRSRMAPDGMPVHELATVADDAVDALERLAERLGAAAPPPPADGVAAAPGGDDPLDAQAVAAILAAAQPEGAIVVDEGITLSQPYFDAAAASPAHTYLAVTGGAIGQGLPTAAGAACACPDRPVIAFQADGSGLYTLQALWTMAREQLDVTVLIAANRSYAIIQLELARAGDGAAFGAASQTLSRLADPAPDWVALAAGMGVPAERAHTTGELWRELARALAEPGPHLVEMVL